jgi:hypothetical protein
MAPYFFYTLYYIETESVCANGLIYFNKLWATGYVKVTKDTEYANRLLCNKHANEEFEYLL